MNNNINKKKINYNPFAGFGILFVAMILVCINLFVQDFDFKYDLTQDKLYTISDQTKKIINNLNQKINIYVLSDQEDDNLIMKNLLEQYRSKNITLEYKNPDTYPDFEKPYEENNKKISEHSIIVASKDKFKVIDSSDLQSYEYDYSTFQKKIKSIDLEPEVTNAIRYVTSNETPIIYKLIGNGEQDLDSSYKKQINLANYDLKELNLIAKDKVPDDCKILFITTPRKDWTIEESKKVEDYLSNGCAMIFMDRHLNDFTNFDNTTKKFGFEFSNLTILENSGDNFIGNNRAYIVPNYTDNSITHDLKENSYSLLIPLCQNINILPDQKDKIKVLLMSSSDSFAKKNLANLTKESGDQNGPLNIAISREDEKSKIIAVGSTLILDDSINSQIAGSNCEFVINSMNWCVGDHDAIYIAPKTHDSYKTNFTYNQSLIIKVVSAIVIPLCLLLIGIIVIQKRKLSR
jgi:ABC-2 type transport system permease protein